MLPFQTFFNLIFFSSERVKNSKDTSPETCLYLIFIVFIYHCNSLYMYREKKGSAVYSLENALIWNYHMATIYQLHSPH